MPLSRNRIKDIVTNAIQDVNFEALTMEEEDEIADEIISALADEAPELIEEEDEESEGEDEQN